MLPFLACQQSLTDALGGGQDLLHHAIRSILVSPDLSWAGSLAQAARQLFVAAAATTKSIDPFASNPQLRCPCTAFLGLTSICAHPFFVAFEGLHFLVQNFSPLNRSGVADVAEWLRQSQPLPELTDRLLPVSSHTPSSKALLSIWTQLCSPSLICGQTYLRWYSSTPAPAPKL
jgi:hypothetical protein